MNSKRQRKGYQAVSNKGVVFLKWWLEGGVHGPGQGWSLSQKGLESVVVWHGWPRSRAELRWSQDEQILSRGIYEQNIQPTLVLQGADLTLCSRQSLALCCVLLPEGEEFSSAPDWSWIGYLQYLLQLVVPLSAPT